MFSPTFLGRAAIPVKRLHKGFILIELLAATAVIVIVAAILFPVFAPTRENAPSFVPEHSKVGWPGSHAIEPGL